MKLLSIISILLVFSVSLAQRKFQPWQGTYKVAPYSFNDALCCLPASSVVLSNTQTAGNIVNSVEGRWESSAGCKAIGVAGQNFKFSTVDTDFYAFSFPGLNQIHITALRETQKGSTPSLGTVSSNGLICYADLRNN